MRLDEKVNLERWNFELRDKTPNEIIDWVLIFAKRPIVSTKFGPRSASLLHAVSCFSSKIDVVWVDTGYNTSQTYLFANKLIDQLGLKMNVYVPLQTVAYRNAIMGMPAVGTKEHQLFTEQVKIEPFKRALEFHKPDVWFTNIRKGQTEHRDSLDILSIGSNGILKVSPFYYYDDVQIDQYLETHKLPNQPKYFDPTKVISNRECGLHLM